MPRPPSKGGVSSPFGMRVNPNDGKYRMHYGEDTLGVGNYAPVSGTVVFAGYDHTGTGLGWCVIIQEQGTGTKTVPQVMWAVAHHGTGHGEGPSPLRVKVGQTVVEGVTYLGPKGDSGAAQGPHAHTERRYGGLAQPGTGTATNPRDYYTSTAGGDVAPFTPGRRKNNMSVLLEGPDEDSPTKAVLVIADKGVWDRYSTGFRPALESQFGSAVKLDLDQMSKKKAYYMAPRAAGQVTVAIDSAALAPVVEAIEDLPAEIDRYADGKKQS